MDQTTPQPSDVIFVYGGLDLQVPIRAADIYNRRLATKVLVTGSYGPFSEDVFDQPEAYVFRDKMIDEGVERNDIITETKATNTLENTIYGMNTLDGKNIKVNKAILVAKPFIMRRCAATFEKQYPRVETRNCPPRGSIMDFCDRPKDKFAKRLIAEVDRLKRYSKKGDISKQEIPTHITTVIKRIEERLQD